MYSKTFVFSKTEEEKVNTDCLVEEIRFREEVPRAGNYEMVVELAGSGTILIFTDTGKLVYKQKLIEKQSVICNFSLNVCDVIPKGMTCLYEKRSVDIRIHGEKLTLYSIYIKQVNCPTLYVAGDAGMELDSVRTGIEWGKMIPAYVGRGAAVSDHVREGMAMRAFRMEGHYALIQAHIKLGDYLMLQFSRDERNVPKEVADVSYRDGLLRYIEETRARGAHPILVTPMERKQQGKSFCNVEADAEICRELGKNYHVPVIDIQGECVEDAYKLAGLIVRKYNHLFKHVKVDAYSRLTGFFIERVDHLEWHEVS